MNNRIKEIATETFNKLPMDTSNPEKCRVFSLPQETVDSITKANLIDCKDYLESELKQWGENPRDDNNPDGYWIHPDDIVINMKLIRAMKFIIDYYGGEE